MWNTGFRRVLLTAVIASLVLPATRSFSQVPPPVFNKIDMKAQPGQEVELTLTGKRLKQIKRIEEVRIGASAAEVLDFAPESDSVLRITIRIPRDARLGRYPISIQVSGEGFSGPLRREVPDTPEPAPEPSRTTRDEEQPPVASTPADRPRIVLLAEGRPVEGSPVDFGTTDVGSPVTRTLEIRNVGTAPLILGRPELPRGFRLVDSFPENVAPENSAAVTLQMEAAFANTFGGVLEFVTNIPGQSRFALPLQGRVMAATQPTPSRRFAWWIVVPLGLSGLGAVFAVRYAIRKAGASRGSDVSVSTASPVIEFNPQKDMGRQRTTEGEPIQADFELRVKPDLDFGRQQILTSEAFVLEEVKVVGAAAAESQPPSGADDLTQIEGIGPKISTLLQSAGIQTFAQLADADVGRLQQILNQARLWYAQPATWPKQAGLASAGDWDRLAELQAELKGGRDVPENG